MASEKEIINWREKWKFQTLSRSSRVCQTEPLISKFIRQTFTSPNRPLVTPRGNDCSVADAILTQFIVLYQISMFFCLLVELGSFQLSFHLIRLKCASFFIHWLFFSAKFLHHSLAINSKGYFLFFSFFFFLIFCFRWKRIWRKNTRKNESRAP